MGFIARSRTDWTPNFQDSFICLTSRNKKKKALPHLSQKKNKKVNADLDKNSRHFLCNNNRVYLQVWPFKKMP